MNLGSIPSLAARQVKDLYYKEFIMQLHTIRGGSRERLEAKEYRLSIGVSLGNKWFVKDNIIELIRWSLSNSTDSIVVYVGDSIHAINIEVKNRISYDKALEKAKSTGSLLLREVSDEVPALFSTEDAKRVTYATWDDLVDKSYKNKVRFLYDFYSSNKEFKELIQSIVREVVITSERLGHYILEELPHQISRVQIGGEVYDALVYPYDGRIPELVEKLQNGTIFPEIGKLLIDTEPKVFLEVR